MPSSKNTIKKKSKKRSKSKISNLSIKSGLSKKIIKLPKRNRVDKNKKISINFNRNYSQRVDFKPSGLWYACNNEWLKFTQDWISEKHHKYIHKLNIKRNVLTNIR